MMSIEEKDRKSLSPDGDLRSESDGFSESSITSLSGSAGIRVALDLHRHNTQLLREKQEMENKHTAHIVALRRRILELEGYISRILAKNGVDATNQTDPIDSEARNYKAMLHHLEERNGKLDSQINDLMRQLADVEAELNQKNGEIADLKQQLIEKDTAIGKLEADVAYKDHLIQDLQTECDADNARMESVNAVQVAYEALRKNCHDKDSKMQDLEDVLDLTIREKEHLSSTILRLQEENRVKDEELVKFGAEFNEFKVNTNIRYEDTLQRLVAKVNELSIVADSRQDNSGTENNAYAFHGKCCPLDVTDGSYSKASVDEPGPELVNGSSYRLFMLTAGAFRTIETIRTEYQVEVNRNKMLLQENERLAKELDRLNCELFGEMQNGSMSSFNCVLLAKNVDGNESLNESVKSSRQLCGLKDELRRTVEERDEAKTKLSRLITDLDQLSAENHGFLCRVHSDGKEISRLRMDLKEAKKYQFAYLRTANCCKSLVFQKEYLTNTISNLKSCDSSRLVSFEDLNQQSQDLLGPRIITRARQRFRRAILVIMAINRMKQKAKKMDKYKAMYNVMWPQADPCIV